MKVLITGGAGFIGSHLGKALVEKGHDVVCVDNLLTGNKRNIEKLLENDTFTFVEHDITDPNYKLQLTNYKFDYIYHLASPASPVQYQCHPIETLEVNTIGTHNILKLAKDTGAKFLYTSTSEVYGNPLEHPQKETYWGNVNSYGPRSCYDESKRCGEAYVYTFVKEHNVDARIVRIFNTYGPNMEQNDGRVVSNFAEQAVSGKAITVHGNGAQTRSFCYVSDMVDGLIKALEKDNTKGEIINLGNPDERTILEIAELVKKLSSSASEITHIKEREEDISRRKPDSTKAMSLLGWKPEVPLEKGLNETIQFFRTLNSS